MVVRDYHFDFQRPRGNFTVSQSLDKLTSTVDKPFEGIKAKQFVNIISHSLPDNMNSYRMDEDFLWMDGSAVGTADDFLWMDGSAVQSLNILACTCTKTGRNNKMRQPNWISTVKAVYEHCMYKHWNIWTQLTCIFWTKILVIKSFMENSVV